MSSLMYLYRQGSNYTRDFFSKPIFSKKIPPSLHPGSNSIILFLELDFVMKDIIYLILAIIIAGLTFAFMVKKMKDDCIP